MDFLVIEVDGNQAVSEISQAMLQNNLFRRNRHGRIKVYGPQSCRYGL